MFLCGHPKNRHQFSCLTATVIFFFVASGPVFAQDSLPARQNDQELIKTIEALEQPPAFLDDGDLPPMLSSKNAQPVLSPPVELTVEKGLPLRVILKKAVSIKKAGQPITAYLTDPVYAFDRLVVPAGSEVDGHIVKLTPPSGLRKAGYYLNADFSSHRAVEVEFDLLILPNGKRISLQTKIMPSVGPVLKLETNPRSNGKVHRARGFISTQWHGAIAELRPSALWRHAKALVSSETPYHKQKLDVGSVFVAELEQPLDFGPATVPPTELGAMGQLPDINAQAFARLTAGLSSATTRAGTPVEAVLTRPVFSSDGKLLLPVGTALEGTVVRAKPARRLHRNGQLHFTLNRVQLPSSTAKSVEMALEGVEVPKSSHIQVDSEGQTSVAGNGESRVLRTAFSAAIANSTFDSDSGHAGATATSENRPLGGLSGYKVIGFALSIGARSPILSRALGLFGTGESVYLHFITRGQDLVLPRDTPIEVSFGEARVRRPAKHAN